MKVKLLGTRGSWRDVADSARTTINKEAWQEVLNSIKDTEPELYRVCVPDCIYRGWCYEYKSCGYHKTEGFKEKLKQYREGVNE